MIVAKMDILEMLKERGYNSYRMKNEKILSQSTIQNLRDYKPSEDLNLGLKSLDVICRILQCQPGDILEWVPDKEE